MHACHGVDDPSYRQSNIWDVALYWQILNYGIIQFLAKLKGILWPNKLALLNGHQTTGKIFLTKPVLKWARKYGTEQIYNDGTQNNTPLKKKIIIK